jgi:protein-tyrosine phosphatase
MDRYNLRNITRIIPSDPKSKISRLLDFNDRPNDVADPCYTGDFDATWRDVNDGCSALLQLLRREYKL